MYNLGSGKGYSVFEMIKSLEKASQRKIAYKITGRREGDIAAIWTDTGKAEKELGWKAERPLEEMCEDLWKWQTLNPHGYTTPVTA